MLITLLKGMMLGFSIAFPIGPVTMLFLRNTISYGLTAGLISGIGVSVAEAFYGALAGCCFSLISMVLLKYGLFINVTGALFIGYLGFSTYRSIPDVVKGAKKKVNFLRVFGEPFLLSLASPMTIVLFAAFYANMGLDICSQSFLNIIFLTVGVFLGAMAWWVPLGLMIAYVERWINHNRMVWINKISGIILLIFAAYSLYSSLSLLV